MRCDVINAIQVSTLSESWCGDNSCGIQTPYFHVLPNSLRCIFTVLWEHWSRSAKQHVASVGSSSISCYKTSTFVSRGLAECRELSSSPLPLLNRLNQCCAVRIERMSTPIVRIYFLLLPSPRDPKEIQEAEVLGALDMINKFVTLDQRQYPWFFYCSKETWTSLPYP